MILIIVDKEIEEKVMKSIYEAGQFEQASNGIVFSQELTATLGISG